MYVSVSLDSVVKKRDVLLESVEPNKSAERMTLNGVNFSNSKKNVRHNDKI
jgi:hypothetical protein